MAHGAWANGSSWARVMSPLIATVHKVLAPPLPLTSFDADVAAVERGLERVTGPIVLVAHALLAALQLPIAPACISTRVGRPRWRDLPSWFLVAEHDYMILPESQRFMAQRMRARVRTAEVDHTPMVTAPTAVVEIVREAIAEVGTRR